MGLFSKIFSKGEKVNPNGLYAPVAGEVVPLSEVPDPTFSEGMLGNGVAIKPVDGKVYAPCDAVVETMFDTGHAVALTSKNGAELLIHVGLETVGLNGAPFTVHVKNGDTVKKGDLLMEADLQAIEAAGLNVITPFLVCNSDDFSKFKTRENMSVTNEDVVIELAK